VVNINYGNADFGGHHIRTDSDLQTHVDCIHYNPVKHQIVKRTADWPYSSVQNTLRMVWRQRVGVVKLVMVILVNEILVDKQPGYTCLIED